LAVYATLVILSHSATAYLLSFLYVGGAFLYVLWRRHRFAAAVALTNCVLVLIAAVVALWSDPSLALTALGKDATLTGRTTLWNVVLEFIREKPLLGWGYRAMWVSDDATTILADKLAGWSVTSSHNAFLSVTLELGLVGMGVMLMILWILLWRGIRCCRAGIAPLGWFSVVFVVGAILAAQTIETLGRNQTIEWVLFNILLFGCGLELAALRHISPEKEGK
jgi:O-antigen ligase